jgi:predicted P-loop ATPase
MTVTTDPNVSTKFDPGFDAWIDPALLPTHITLGSESLNKLSRTRADNYDQWRNVGMALRPLGQDGLFMWDMWSKQSANYQPGVCASLWIKFTQALVQAEGITFDNLLEWAQEDNRVPFVRPCPKGAKPSDYRRAFMQLGYRFALNEMNDGVFMNGARMTDPVEAKIINSMREHGYKLREYVKDTILEMAFDNQFHPIRDYLLNCPPWDGTDHIAKLALYFQDKNDVFPILLRKWLIGAVARVLKPHDGIQNPMLVLDGPQNLGKSYLAWWLCSPIPAYFLDSAIAPGEKDNMIRACSYFVWEVSELGATTRRADLEALKAFITQRTVTVRVPYGKHDIQKPPTASFIGTINNVGGFLSDPTGHRRYRTCTLTSIDWDYSKQVNVTDIWAQAVALFLSGETNELDPVTQVKVNEINAGYEIDDPLEYLIFSKYEIDPTKKAQYTATAQIIKELRSTNDIVDGNDKQLEMRIGAILVKAKCEKTTITINGQRVRAWVGVWK